MRRIFISLSNFLSCYLALVTTFNVEIGITGAILTKLDGDSRGGAALSVKEVRHLYLFKFPFSYCVFILIQGFDILKQGYMNFLRHFALLLYRPSLFVGKFSF